jgi:hypothetical protein
MLVVQISVPWLVGPVGTVWLILRLVGCLKVGKLDLSSEGKWGKPFFLCMSYINGLEK